MRLFLRLANPCALWALVGTLSLSGCFFKNVPKGEATHADYQKAQQYKREGRQQEALAAFIEVAEQLRHAPETHLEIGLLYLHHAQDPIEAIHYFRRFLEQAPAKAPQRQLVKELILKSQKECLRQLSLSTQEDPLSRNEFWNQLQQARKDNLQLQATILQLKERMEASHTLNTAGLRTPGIKPHKPKQLLVRTHIVKEGETLSSISKEVYGTTQRWEDILRANPSLRSPQDLRVGQQIELP